MSKLIVSAKSKDHLLKLLKKDIDGVIIYLEGLSVNSDFYLGIEDVSSLSLTPAKRKIANVKPIADQKEKLRV